jgi:hypothetical protein
MKQANTTTIECVKKLHRVAAVLRTRIMFFVLLNCALVLSAAKADEGMKFLSPDLKYGMRLIARGDGHVATNMAKGWRRIR